MRSSAAVKLVYRIALSGLPMLMLAWARAIFIDRRPGMNLLTVSRTC